MNNADFGSKHLTGLVWLFALIAALLVVILYIRKRYNKGEEFDRAVIRYTAYFLWAMEIVRSIRLINGADFGPVGYYPLWMGPFHICSMALYAFPIIGAKIPGKLEKWVRPFGYAVMLVVTMIILAIPASSGILGTPTDWSLVYDNFLPYQSWLYHGTLVFVPLYMVLSGFYRPNFRDLYRSATVFAVVAVFAQALNYILDGSGADFMTLRYGNGNPFAFLLADTPLLYYVVITSIALTSTSLVLLATIGINKLVDKRKK